tara:strand:- start:863 stop:1012 length:150 start_codon:yes stop_codon:yes gene_type:complete
VNDFASDNEHADNEHADNEHTDIRRAQPTFSRDRTLVVRRDDGHFKENR